MSSLPPDHSAALPKGAKNAIIAASVGTLIEWYDYALYGAAAGLVINRLFFPELLPQAGALAAFATFAVGFFIRPLGGVVISHIGDRFGRKPALILSVVLMGAATVLIGLLPTYASIGIWATLLLVLLRLIQGFGAGAELAGALTLVAEFAPPHRRGLYTAIPNACTAAGGALATLAFLSIAGLPEEILFGWAWRIPFLVSAILFVLAIYIRRRMDETPEYVAAMEKAEKRKAKERIPIRELLRRSRREVTFGFLSVSGHNAWAYLISAFALSYMVVTLNMTLVDALIPVLSATICGVLMTPVFGFISDKVGYKAVFILGATFAIVWVFPLFVALGTKNVLLASIAMGVGYGIGFGAMAGSQGAFLANLFPARYRYSGIAFTRELNGVLVAGPTPFIAAALVIVAGGSFWLVSFYVIFCCLLTIAGVLLVGRHGNVPPNEDEYFAMVESDSEEKSGLA